MIFSIKISLMYKCVCVGLWDDDQKTVRGFFQNSPSTDAIYFAQIFPDVAYLRKGWGVKGTLLLIHFSFCLFENIPKPSDKHLTDDGKDMLNRLENEYFYITVCSNNFIHLTQKGKDEVFNIIGNTPFFEINSKDVFSDPNFLSWIKLD